MIKMIDARIRRHLSGIRLAFRGVVTLVKAAGAVQLVQMDGLSGERLQNNELIQHYGYTSNPPAGSMAIVLPIGGKTAHGIIIATEHGTYRLKNLASGEVALYDDQGQKVHLTRDGIVIDGGGLPITIQNTPHVIADTDKLTITGDLEVLGKADVTGDVTSLAIITGATVNSIGNISAYLNGTPISMNNMKTVYNGHTHTDPQGGSVGTPSGLM